MGRAGFSNIFFLLISLIDLLQVNLQENPSPVYPVPDDLDCREIIFSFQAGDLQQDYFQIGYQLPQALLPGQSEVFEYPLAMDEGTKDDLYKARILIDPDNPTFNECKDDNNETPETDVYCVG